MLSSWVTFLTNAHARTPRSIICTLLFVGKLTNQNWAYYKVNDKDFIQSGFLFLQPNFQNSLYGVMH